MPSDLLVTIADLRNRELLKNFQDYFLESVLKFGDAQEAGWFIGRFRKVISDEMEVLKVDDHELAVAWQRLLIQNCLIGFQFLDEDSIVNLFRDHGASLLGLPENIDVWPKICVVLIARHDYEDRDKFKGRLREALESCDERLTSTDLLISSGSVPPSVGNWLKDYFGYVGAAEVNTLKQAEYLTTSTNAKKISAGERAKIKRLIELYERLKLSSLTAEGLEDPVSTVIDGKEVTLRDGEFQEVDPRLVRLLMQFKEKGLITEDLPETILKGVVATTRLLADEKKLPIPIITTVNQALPIKITAPSTPQSPAPPIPVAPKVEPTPPPLKPPEPAAFMQAGPAFIIDAADEREVDKFRLPDQPANAPLEARLRTLAEGAVKHYGFSFKDEGNRRRFVNLFVSFLKDVRNVVEAREALLRPIESGGLGLTQDKVEQVITIINQVKQDYAKQASAVPSPATKPVKPLDKLMQSDISQFLLNPNAVQPTRPSPDPSKSAAPVPPAPPPQPQQPKVSIMPAPGPVKLPVPPAPATPAGPQPKLPGEFSPDKVQEWRQEMLKEIARVAPPVTVVRQASPAATPTSATPASPVRPVAEFKPRLVDVQAAPRTVGPVGELKSLSLKDFRRLGPTPQALDKVKARVELIGERSVTKRLEAVRAWQASPTYQAYLALGRTSIERNSPVADTAIALEADGEETLSAAEFNAIADFNRKLRLS